MAKSRRRLLWLSIESAAALVVLALLATLGMPELVSSLSCSVVRSRVGRALHMYHFHRRGGVISIEAAGLADFVAPWGGCATSYGNLSLYEHVGTYRSNDSTVSFCPLTPSGWFGRDWTTKPYNFVRWGSRVYLVHSDWLERFVTAYNEGVDGTVTSHERPGILIRSDCCSMPATELPSLPQRVRAMLRPQTLVGVVVETDGRCATVSIANTTGLTAGASVQTSGLTGEHPRRAIVQAVSERAFAIRTLESEWRSLKVGQSVWARVPDTVPLGKGSSAASRR